MATAHQFRVLLLVPVSRKDGLNEFCRRFDPSGDNWIIVSFSSDGAEPVSHYGTCFSCTLPDTNVWAERLTTDGKVALPPSFYDFNVDQRIAFMTAARPYLKQNTGVMVYVCKNEEMPWFQDLGGIEGILETEGLKRIEG